MSHTLVVQYRTQYARHLHKIPLRAKDGLDVFVRGRSFVAQPVGKTVVVPDAVHLAARPDLQPVLDTLRLLGRLGGSPAGDWVGGSVEVLRGSDFALLAEIGADVRASLGWTALTLETYARDPAGK